VTGQVSFNDIASQLAAGTIGAGASYAVDATGRVTVAGLTTTNPSTPANLVLYLDGGGNASVVSMDANEVTAGVAFQQTSGASVSGAYAMAANGNTFITDPIGGLTARYPWSAIGLVSAGSGKASGFTDLNVLTNPQVSGTQTPNVTLNGTSSGTGNLLTGVIGGLGYANTSNQYDYYVIDNNRALAIETDAAQLSEAFAETASSK
jgi:hypothetical protein